MFDENCIWIIDDVLREKDQKLANYISLKFGFIQYRFWNFSILSYYYLSEDILQTIHDASKKEMNKMSKHYMNKYYPAIDLD